MRKIVTTAPSRMDRTCVQCGGKIIMMCQVGTLYCSEGCRKAHARERPAP
jgi:hypothetical protein